MRWRRSRAAVRRARLLGRHSLYAAFTLGGLRTDVDGRVLTGDGTPIPGLFAAGRTTAGLAAPGYASGLSLGDGTYFGRRAGPEGGGDLRGGRTFSLSGARAT